MIIAAINLKGGCGKSTIAVNLACGLVGKRSAVLVDADSQGTATFYASKGLLPITCESWPVETESRIEGWVKRVISLQGDYVVIDAPPHVGAVTQAIVGIADLVIVPIAPSAADLMATGRALELIRAARSMRKDKGPRCLLVPSKVDTRTVSGRELVGALEGIAEAVGPVIHQRAAFVDALSAGRWVGDYAPGSAAASDIEALVSAVRKVSV